MRHRVIVWMLVAAVLVPEFAFAQDGARLARAVRKAAAQAPAQTPASNPAHAQNRYFWPGLALIGAGGTLAVLGATAAKKETCGVVSVGFDVVGGCVEETNKPLLWTGVAAAAGGGTLLAIGGTRHQVAFGPGVVRYRVRF